MSGIPEREDERVLLDEAIADPDWHAWNLSVREQALSALRARRSKRLWRRRMCGAALIVLLAGGAVWFSRDIPEPRPEIAGAGPSAETLQPETELAIREFSDEELLSLFPEGSCLVAEIDGEVQLVVLDSKAAAEGIPLP